MEITLNSAFAATLPYAPYIAAGIATIAALAAIYFYIQSRKGTTPPPTSDPTPKSDPIPDPAPKPAPDVISRQVVDAFLDEFLTQDLPKAIEMSVIETFNASASAITDKTQATAVRPMLDRALAIALKGVSTCEGLGNLARNFIEQTYSAYTITTHRPYGKLLKHRPTQDYLMSQFKEIWEHFAARAEILLPLIPDTEKEAFKAAGTEILTPKFEETEDLDEKRRLASDLKALGAEGNWDEVCQELESRQIKEEFWGAETPSDRKEEIFARLQELGQDTEREQTEMAMLNGNYNFVPDGEIAKEALALHKDLTELTREDLVTTYLIADRVPEGLFNEGVLSYIDTSEDRNAAMHRYTTHPPWPLPKAFRISLS